MFFFTEIPDFLTHAECDHFIKVAKETGLKESNTYRDLRHQGINLMDLNTDKHLDINEVSTEIFIILF